jgi:hypothetical protein
MDIKEINYLNYGKCLQVSNGIVDFVATLDVGPRIIRFGFCGQPNEFCDTAPLRLQVGDDEWRLRGGHRLWCSPEIYPRTYVPDNKPVPFEQLANGVCLTWQVDWTQVKKEMEVTLAPAENKVTVRHRITNKNAWDIRLAAWALSVMAPGGLEVIPQAIHESNFLDGATGLRNVTLWSFARMNDPRVYWGAKYITLRHDATVEGNFKCGISNEAGWAAYFNHGNLFINRFAVMPDAAYPDRNVSYETFTTDFMLEMETLSPLATLKPDDSIEHIETWELIAGVSKPEIDEQQIEQVVAQYIRG